MYLHTLAPLPFLSHLYSAIIVIRGFLIWPWNRWGEVGGGYVQSVILVQSVTVPCMWDLTVWLPHSIHLHFPQLQIFRPCIYPSPGCNSGLPMFKVIRVAVCPMTQQRFYCIMGRVENYFSSVSCPSCMGVAPLLRSAPW